MGQDKNGTVPDVAMPTAPTAPTAPTGLMAPMAPMAPIAPMMPTAPFRIGNIIDDYEDDIRTDPAVKDLEQLDDAYLALQRDHAADLLELEQRFDRQFAELTARRCDVLSRPGPSAPAPTGSGPCATPGLPGFWRAVLQNSAEFQEDIERHDEPVLEYLRLIRSEWLEDSERDRGFRICFIFDANPYFSNATLEKVYHTEAKNKYFDRLDCAKIDAPKIEWYPGKNVTVEVVSRKPKSGGRRRQPKPRKEELPRPSFFRTCFRSLGPGEEIPEEELDEADVDESMDLMNCLVDDDYEQGLALRKYLIPHAVRWYTGEACDDLGESDGADGEEDEEEDEEEDDEEDDEDEDDEEEEAEETGRHARHHGVPGGASPKSRKVSSKGVKVRKS